MWAGQRATLKNYINFLCKHTISGRKTKVSTVNQHNLQHTWPPKSQHDIKVTKDFVTLFNQIIIIWRTKVFVFP